jgi:hypothetical protein
LIEAGSLAGFVVEADMPLSGLPPVAAGQASRRLLLRKVAAGELATLAARAPASLRLGLAHVGEFLVTGPGEVVVAPAPTASSAQISAFLFGPCFSALAYLNGLVPLHAALADVRGDAIALAGPSGSGKSTLAGALAALGAHVASDDVCFLEVAKGGQVLWPGVPRLRLNHDSATALGHAQGPDRLAPGGKHHLALASAAAARPLTPAAIYVLDAKRHDGAASIDRVRGAAAAELVIANAHRTDLARELGAWPNVVSLGARLANQIPVYAVRRTLDLERLGETAEVLLRHACGDVAAAGSA